MDGIPEPRRPMGGCPTWCRLTHGQLAGEEDVIHLSEQVSVRNTVLRLCASIDPTTEVQDGPYILMGASEFTLDEATALADALCDLTAKGRAAAFHVG